MSDTPELPGEGAEVEALHRTLMREASEPTEGREPAPWWLWATIAVVIFVGGYTLGRYGGVLGLATHVAYRGAPEAPPEVKEALLEAPDGAQVYQSRCATCHQADGRGVPNAFPPLVGSEWVEAPPELAVRVVLRGLTGPISVAGQTWNGAMPGWADQLTDAEIAAVVTHEREMAGVTPAEVPVDLVERLRAETEGQGPYTAAELEGAP